MQVELSTDMIHKMRDFLDPDALLILVHTAEGIRLVARSTTDQINVAALASHFGGGGHERAAAALIRPRSSLSTAEHLNLDNYIEQILSVLPACIHPSLTVEQIMSRNPKILRPDTPAEKAAELMARYGYEGYPVIENNQVVGLLTRRLVDRSLAFNLNLPAGSLMEAGNFSVTQQDSIDDLQQIMTISGWGQIPVIDSVSGKVTGIVTRTDVLKAISSRRSKTAQPRQHNLAARLDSTLPPGKLALLKTIAGLAQQQHLNLYIVGGFVRDLLLNRPGADFDMVVEGDAIQLGHKLVEIFGGKLLTHKQFGTAKWQITHVKPELSRQLQIQNPDDLPDSLDLISSRIEFYDRPSALPTVERSSIKLDLHRRDFSINTLALRLDGAHFGDLYDYWGGMNDLRQGSIRVLHSLSFVDDPTRMLRAVRFEQRFNFRIENRTLKLMKEAHSLVENVSGDRLQHEFNLIFQESDPGAILTRTNHLGLLSAIHPCLKWTVEDESLLKLSLTNEIPAFWNLGAYYHHTPTRNALCYLLWFSRFGGKTGLSISKRLHLPGYIENAIRDLCALKPCLPDLATKKPSEVYQLLIGIPDIILYCASLINPSEACRQVLTRFKTSWEWVNPSVNGKILQELKIKPGPIYAQIIGQVRNAWLDGIVTTTEEELEYLDKILGKYSESEKNEQ